MTVLHSAPVRQGARPARLLFALLLCASCAGVGTFSLPAEPFVDNVARLIPSLDPGALLLNELNCAACHQQPVIPNGSGLGPRQAPHLGDAGARLTPQFLRAFLSAPDREKPGTTMPDLLHGMGAGERGEAVENLVQFLATLGAQPPEVPTGADPFKIQQGRVLYHAVGCVACHAPQEGPSAVSGQTQDQSVPDSGGEWADLARASVPLGTLSSKTTVSRLAEFLQDPLTLRPSGRMPSLNLTENEAVAIAMYLLRDQAAAAPGTPRTKMKGLTYQYFEGQFKNTSSLDTMKPVTSGFVENFTLRPRKREENIGFRFTGFLVIEKEGVYDFYAASDDGSRVFVKDQLVVDNDGEHGMTEKKGSIRLAPGEVPIMVTYYNAGGGSGVRISYAGPDFGKRQVPAAALLTDQGQPMLPLNQETFPKDPAKAAKGKDLFRSLGCVQCHALDGMPSLAPGTFKTLSDADPSASSGCLGDRPGRGAPEFGLSLAQRSALRRTLSAKSELARVPTPQEQVVRSMAALNCYACHARGNVGGPAPGRAEYFTSLGGADVGDEGRIPPHLTAVGGKLRPDWTREVLVNKGAVRPYMTTRMPQFGEKNAGGLALAFEQADSSPENDAAVEITDAKWGRKLVGVGGMVCISCHTFAGQKSLGMPAIDLVTMARRLKRDWFHRYLLDPPSLRPGTRMPAFWPEGISVRQDVLDGNTPRQIDAIWAYLFKGKEGGLPPGLIQGKVELVATNEAVLYRNFIAGAGSRAIGVGYPEKANLAFDANDLRIALIWQGPFIDAAQHREGRGAGFVAPLGYNVISMPAGSPFAVLGNPDEKWPGGAGKTNGYQMKGYHLDEKRRPKFLYSFNSISVEDYPVGVAGDLDGFLRRSLTLQSVNPVRNLWFRAWVGDTIQPQADGTFLADGKLKLRLTSGNSTPLVRRSNGKSELLIQVPIEGSKAQVLEELIW